MGLKSHCHRAHLMEGDNLVIKSDGGRRCRECHNLNERGRKARRRQEYLEHNPKLEKVITTQCLKGHSLAGKNLYIRPSNGDRLCRKCSALNAKNRRIQNPDILKKEKIWKENNREWVIEYNKTWYENNKERELIRGKIWKEHNKERVAITSKVWRENNKERVAITGKIWHEKNPEKRRLYEQKRRAFLTGSAATLIREEWIEIQKEFKGNCFWCGEGATTLEHLVPLSPRKGELQGHHTKSNVVPSCQPCNSRKHNMDPLKFYFRMQEEVKNLEGVF